MTLTAGALAGRMTAPRPILRAWRTRRDTRLRDALWLAACWEVSGALADVSQAVDILEAAEACDSPFCGHAGADCLWWADWHDRRATERMQGQDAEADAREIAAARERQRRGGAR